MENTCIWGGSFACPLVHGISCPVQKSSLDLESTDALLAKVLVFASSQAELLEDSFEGQLEVLLKPLCRLFSVLLELKAVLNQSVENWLGFQTSNLGNHRSACLQELKSLAGWENRSADY